MDELFKFLSDMALMYPALAGVLSVLYIIGLVNKPLFSILKSIVDYTVSTKDNEFYDKIVNSKAYKYISYVLDWSIRFKAPKVEQKEEIKIVSKQSA